MRMTSKALIRSHLFSVRKVCIRGVLSRWKGLLPHSSPQGHDLESQCT